MSAPDSRRIAVIGGGLSGLAAAHRLSELASDSDVVHVYEACRQPGGLIATVREGGCVLDLGADSFITNKPAAVRLCERLGLADRLRPTSSAHRGAFVLHDGKPTPVPDGFQLMLPTNIDAVLASPLLSDEGKQRFLAERDVPPKMEDDEESLSQFVTRRFGAEVHDRLVQPLVGGIYTADPDRLSIQATLPRFPELERRHGSLIAAAEVSNSESDSATETGMREVGSGARYGLFATLPGGMKELITVLSARVRERCTFRGKSMVESLAPHGSGYRLTTGYGSEEYDGVVLAVPAWSAARLTSGFDEVLAERLASIEYASTAIVVSVHEPETITHPLDAFGLVVPRVENRRVLAVSFSHRKFPERAPGGQAILRTFVGGALQPHLLDQEDDAIVQLVSEELDDLFGLTAPPSETLVARWNRSMPQYLLGHRSRVEAIREREAVHDRLQLAGNAYDGVGIPDAIASGEHAAEALLSGW